MWLLTLSSLICVAQSVYGDSGVDTGAQTLAARGNVLLSTGQFNEAAKTYTDAIELSPGDYLLYYKRATAYFSSSRHANALDDFDKVLELTSNSFSNSWLMKAKIHTREGRWQEARENLKLYTTKVKSDETATDMIMAIGEAESAVSKATKAKKSQLWTACTEAASQALKTASHSLHIRQLRAECALAAGDFEGAVGDLGRLTHLSSPSATSLVRLFRIAYFFLPTTDTVNAMAPLKTCLHLDPDSKPCLTAHRLVKAFNKSFTKMEQLLSEENYRGVISLLTGPGKNADFAQRFDTALEDHTTRDKLLLDESKIPLPDPKLFSPRRKDIIRALCKSYVQVNAPKKAEPWCETLLKMEGMAEDVDGLVGKGESALLREEWDEAVRAFEKAFEVSGRGNRDIHGRLQKAQRLLKQSRQNDYYKVLGVARDADTKTIKKAYRKAAMTAHPDKKGGSETKMAALNQAYEVLSNPELRQRYDQGDDPNDPASQQGGHPFSGGAGGGHPFAQFFQQQGGGFPGGGSGGFQFHFQQ